MRIIHTSNLNLEAIPSGFDNIRAKERKNEIISNFERLVDFAKRNKIEIIIISGDLFAADTITLKTKEMVINQIMKNPTIDFLYVSGKFDKSFIESMEIIPSNLKLFDNDFYTISYKDVDITGVNYSNVYKYNNLSLNQSKTNIVCMYGDVESEINVEKLKDKGIDYLALGGLNDYTQKALDNRGIYSYPGSLEAVSLTDFGLKGFVLIEINGKNLDYEFMPFAKRTSYNVKFDVTGIETEGDFKRALNRELEGISDDDIVFMTLTGGYDLDIRRSKDETASILKDRFYYASLKDKTHIYVDLDDYSNDVSLKGEFIRTVMASHLSDNDKEKVIEYGIKALLKEEF